MKVEMSALSIGRHIRQGIILSTHFYLNLSPTKGLSAAGGSKLMKNYTD